MFGVTWTDASLPGEAEKVMPVRHCSMSLPVGSRILTWKLEVAPEEEGIVRVDRVR